MTDQGVTHYKIKHVKPDMKRHFVNVLVCSKNTEKKKNHLGSLHISIVAHRREGRFAYDPGICSGKWKINKG